MGTIGILAYGSLIEDSGAEILNLIVDRINTTTPFAVEFARISGTRNDAPTLIPFTDGTQVNAQIFVLQTGITVEQAVNMLYQRETRQQRKNYVRPSDNDITPNTVLIEALTDFEGVNTVLYTKIGSNIEHLTPLFLANKAIESARAKAGADRMDGINYLIAVKRNRIRTVLSDEYEEQILRITGTDDLEAAYQHCRINFVKLNMSIFIPALIRLVEGLDFPWDRIDRLFLEELSERKNRANGEIIVVDATIFDVIVEAKKGNSTAIGYLDFLNRLFQEIMDNLPHSERRHIQSNITNMLTKYDKGYWGFVAELATFNNIIKSKAYELVGSEIRLPGTKPIDFKFHVIKKDSDVFVEILSIHTDSDRIEVDPDKRREFLLKRIADKIEGKRMDFEKYPNLYLVIVLWGNAEAVKAYSDFFKKHSLGLTNVLEPVSYITYSDGNGYYEHHFKTISNLVF